MRPRLCIDSIASSTSRMSRIVRYIFSATGTWPALTGRTLSSSDTAARADLVLSVTAACSTCVHLPV
jgi:hypothetical protein